MKAKVTLYKNDGEAESGYPVKLIISHNRRTRRRTISYALEIDWNVAKDVPRPSHEDFEDLYTTILHIRANAARMEFKRIDDFATAFEYLLNNASSPGKETDFIKYGRAQADYMVRINRPGNGRAYRTAIKELEKYQAEVNFSEITRPFLENFKQYKKQQGVKNTTLRAYLYAFQAIYNNAVKTGVVEDTEPFVDLFKDIKVRKRRAKNRYLEAAEVKKLEAARFENSDYELAKDLALLQFYMAGADFVDICYLRRDKIRNGRVILSRAKLGEKAYEFDILLTEKAQEIIQKYQADEGDYVFPWRKDDTGYRTFRVKVYRDLQQVKEILELEISPLDSTFTLKLMRHTFATLGKFLRVEEDLLRELMGHERYDIDTVYKDKYLECERDAAQLKIIGEK